MTSSRLDREKTKNSQDIDENSIGHTEQPGLLEEGVGSNHNATKSTTRAQYGVLNGRCAALVNFLVAIISTNHKKVITQITAG